MKENEKEKSKRIILQSNLNLKLFKIKTSLKKKKQIFN